MEKIMRILIAAVGRAKAGPERALFEHYQGRIQQPFSLHLKEVEEKRPLQGAELKAKTQADADRERTVIIAEAKKRKKKLPGDALVEAARTGDLELTKLLIAAGLSPEEGQYSETPLMKAAYYGRLSIVKYLLDRYEL